MEAVIRVFNRHGNRGNKNKARLKFVMRERGFDWLRDAIEEEYQDILQQRRHRDAGRSSRRISVVFSRIHHRKGLANCCRCSSRNPPTFSALARNQRPAAEAAGLFDRHGHGSARQSDRRSDARPGRACPSRRATGRCAFTMNQNVVLAWVPAGAVKRVYGALAELGLNEAGADEISDVITCPGAYSCNLGLTKTMGLGRGARRDARATKPIPLVRRLQDQRQRLPQFVRPALDRRHRILRQCPQDRGQGSPVLSDAAGRHAAEFGVAIQSLPARLAPVAVERVLAHFKETSAGGRERSAPTCCGTRWRRSAS